MEALLYAPKYSLVAVVAMAKNGVIGDGRNLLWHIPDELKRTKERTMGRPLIMGRRTFESIGRALPGRANIVLTRRGIWQPEGVEVVHTIEDALAKAEEWIEAEPGRKKEIIIFGGGQIYQLFFPQLDCIDATLIERDYHTDQGVAFPKDDFEENWKRDETYPTERIEAKGDIPAYSYVRYVRQQPRDLLERMRARSVEGSQ